MRRLHPRGPNARAVVVDTEGATLGPDCVLVDRRGQSYRCISPVTAGAVQAVLRLDVDDPNWVFKQCRRIADALSVGEIALAQILSDAYMHETIDHAIAFVDGNVHTNNVENFWSLLKRALKGTYVSVDPVHLDVYLDEHVFRFNEHDDTDAGHLRRVLSSVTGKTVDLRKAYWPMPQRERPSAGNRAKAAESAGVSTLMAGSSPIQKFNELARRVVNVPREELRREQE
jgi:hypothetical protein